MPLLVDTEKRGRVTSQFHEGKNGELDVKEFAQSRLCAGYLLSVGSHGFPPRFVDKSVRRTVDLSILAIPSLYEFFRNSLNRLYL